MTIENKGDEGGLKRLFFKIFERMPSGMSVEDNGNPASFPDESKPRSRLGRGVLWRGRRGDRSAGRD